MIIVCPQCQSKYKFDESKLGDRPKARTKCAKCGGAIEIENPAFGAMTLPPGTYPASAPPPPPPPPAPPAAPRVPLDKTTQAVQAPVAGGSQTSTGRDLHKSGAIALPRDRRFSLAVIQGAATGQIFQITQSRTTMGRAGADIILDDPEASRLHAAVEILGESAILRDLGSTNGTFIEADRIEQQVLNNQMEFRIGSHVLMFIVTEVE